MRGRNRTRRKGLTDFLVIDIVVLGVFAVLVMLWWAFWPTSKVLPGN